MNTTITALLSTLITGLSQAQVDHHTNHQANHNDFTETVGSVHFVMKAIPAGAFVMGCGEQEVSCEPVSLAMFQTEIKPIITQHIGAFYLAETETTWALYEQCIQARACRDNSADGGDNGWGKQDRPIIEVSWDDVTTQFIPWLNQTTDKRYRLPTEAEWEHAARANTASRFSWGDNIDCGHARYGHMNSKCASAASTVPVKSYAPNGFGLYDMHGNVWEFVRDCWAEPISHEPEYADEVACDEVVMKGGSWLNQASYLKTAARYKHDRTYRESGDGFRLALDLVDR